MEGNLWHEYPAHGRAKGIAVNTHGLPYVIGMDDSVHRGTIYGWENGKAIHLTIDHQDRLWAIGLEHSIWYNGDGEWRLFPGAKKGKRIAVSITR